MKKLLVALLLTCVVVLAGCGKKTTKNETADVVARKDLKIMTVASGGTDEELNGTIAQELCKRTGFNITYENGPTDSSDVTTKINSIFQTKADYAGLNVTKDQFFSLLAQDCLADLTPYIENTTYLKNVTSQTGWTLATKDGKIYGIPRRVSTTANNTVIALRLDWLNEYNTANPTAKIEIPSADNGYGMTLSNFKKYTQYVESVKKVDGYVIDKDTYYQENILPAFGIYGEYTDVNGTLYYRTQHPNFQQYVDYVKSLGMRYNEDGASATNGITSLNAEQCGAIRLAFWSGSAVKALMDPNNDGDMADSKLTFVQALVPDTAADTNGHIKAEDVRIGASDGYPYFVVVPAYASAETIKGIISYADALLEPSTFLYASIGVEGVNHKVVDGEYYPILDDGNGNNPFSAWDIADKLMVGSSEESYAKYWWARARKNNYNYAVTLVTHNNLANVGMKEITAAMPPVDAYNQYQSEAAAAAADKLVLLLFEEGTKVTLADVNSAFVAKNGDKAAAGVNEWYAAWDTKSSYNTVATPSFITYAK